jgi:hypothetical protein
MKENSDRASETIPVAELAAEATNDGSPAQSIPEAIPPQARAGRERLKKRTERSGSRAQPASRDRHSQGASGTAG